jgi:hypothetical protein
MMMPIKKWLLQFVVVWPLLFLLLAAIQYVKGRELDYALTFGLLWSSLTLAIFFATRVYYFKRGMACKVCNDLPLPTDENVKN